jgi:hypothetical protein
MEDSHLRCQRDQAALSVTEKTRSVGQEEQGG